MDISRVNDVNDNKQQIECINGQKVTQSPLKLPFIGSLV